MAFSKIIFEREKEEESNSNSGNLKTVIPLEEFMSALISLSYEGDIRNKFFNMEGETKYWNIYQGNKEEFDSLFLEIMDTYFWESVTVGKEQDQLYLLINNEIFFKTCTTLRTLRKMEEFYQFSEETQKGSQHTQYYKSLLINTIMLGLLRFFQSLKPASM